MTENVPPIEVERTVTDVVGPTLGNWLSDLKQAVPRVIRAEDDEAVHDLRVSMRRIRSLLRIVAPIYGRFYVRTIRTEFKQVAGMTGALRDEEVLRETLDHLELSQKLKRSLRRFEGRRAMREKNLRMGVVRLLEDNALDVPMTHLQSLIGLPSRPKLDKEARQFARDAVLAAHGVVEANRSALVSDVAGMHDLRISYKRLRYTIEAFSPVLPPELRAWAHVASKFQKVLGDLHDHDIALDVFRQATSIGDETREAVLALLAERRDRIAEGYLALAGPAGLGL